MNDLLRVIPPALRIEDSCDYCRRSFIRARGEKAICLSCGLENVRPETASLAPAVEKAVRPKPKPKKVQRAAAKPKRK